MSCGGCNAKPVPRDEQRARALLCAVCVRAKHDWRHPIRVGPVECRISGKPVWLHVVDPKPSCPRRRHGTVVQWWGVEWIGVPKPVRIVMAWWLRGPLPGCGCIRRWREAWDRWRKGRVEPVRRKVLEQG